MLDPASYNPYPSHNPYQAPGADPRAYGQAPPGAVPAEIIEALRRTRAWVILVAVLSFVGAGLMLLVTLFVAGGGIPTLPSTFALVYFFMAAAVLLPAWSLSRYGRAIGKLLADGSVPSLQEALDRQRGFWTLIGVYSIISIGIWALGTIGIVAGAAMRH
jgi:hypothetical protein